MDLDAFRSLLAPHGQSALAAAAALDPTEETFLPSLTKLQKHFDSALAKAALETVILRRRAARKFTRAEAMYFTRAGLEMASSEIVSRHRAARYAPFTHRLDLCCGIGGDTIALSPPSPDGSAPPGEGDRGWGLTAVDHNPLHLALAAHNVSVYGKTAHFLEADLTRTPLPPAEAGFFDPGRRAAGRRLHATRGYHPPLSLIDSWLPSLPALGVKISPGVSLSEIEHYDCEIEFISLDGELKECALWFGPLKTLSRRATLLTSSGSVFTLTPSRSQPASESPQLSPPQTCLYEPDPAILRAGLVAQLAHELNAAQLDPDIAYLTSEGFTPTPFARAFSIEAHMPFSQKRLRDKLRAMHVGRVTVKKRGSPLEPEAFARSLRLKGDEERTLFLTYVQGKPWVLIGAPVRQG